jgi:hypothetical protein
MFDKVGFCVHNLQAFRLQSGACHGAFFCHGLCLGNSMTGAEEGAKEMSPSYV